MCQKSFYLGKTADVGLVHKADDGSDCYNVVILITVGISIMEDRHPVLRLFLVELQFRGARVFSLLWHSTLQRLSIWPLAMLERQPFG